MMIAQNKSKAEPTGAPVSVAEVEAETQDEIEQIMNEIEELQQEMNAVSVPKVAAAPVVDPMAAFASSSVAAPSAQPAQPAAQSAQTTAVPAQPSVSPSPSPSTLPSVSVPAATAPTAVSSSSAVPGTPVASGASAVPNLTVVVSSSGQAQTTPSQEASLEELEKEILKEFTDSPTPADDVAMIDTLSEAEIQAELNASPAEAQAADVAAGLDEVFTDDLASGLSEILSESENGSESAPGSVASHSSGDSEVETELDEAAFQDLLEQDALDDSHDEVKKLVEATQKENLKFSKNAIATQGDLLEDLNEFTEDLAEDLAANMSSGIETYDVSDILEEDAFEDTKMNREKPRKKEPRSSRQKVLNFPKTSLSHESDISQGATLAMTIKGNMTLQLNYEDGNAVDQDQCVMISFRNDLIHIALADGTELRVPTRKKAS